MPLFASESSQSLSLTQEIIDDGAKLKAALQPFLASSKPECDDWILFALLSHPQFKIAGFNCNKIKEQLIIAINGESIFKKFLGDSGVDIREKQTLLNNLVKLNIEPQQLSIEGLRSILTFITSNNQNPNAKLTLDQNIESFLRCLAHALFTKWNIDYRTAEEIKTYQKKAQGHESSPVAQKVKKDQESSSARTIQQDFITLLQILPQLLEGEEAISLQLPRICQEKLNVAIDRLPAPFISKLDCSLVKTLQPCTIDWLIDLNIFKEFSWLKVEWNSKKVFLKSIFHLENLHLYNRITDLDLANNDHPMFIAMTQMSYQGFNSGLQKDFFQKNTSLINDELIICASTAFRELEYVKSLFQLQEFLKSSEYHTVNQLDKLIDANGAEVANINAIYSEINQSFSAKAFIKCLLKSHSAVIESLLKSLFPEKYSLAPLAELPSSGDPEPNRIYLALDSNNSEINVVVKHYQNGNKASLFVSKDEFNQKFGQEFSTELLANPENHPGIFKILLTFPGVQNNISPQNMEEEQAKRDYDGALNKIKYIYKLLKKAYKDGVTFKDCEDLKDSLIFKRLAIRYRASQYTSKKERWEIAQYKCLRYIDENLATLMSAESGTPSQSKAPFLWPVYVECFLPETASAKEKEWTIDKKSKFEDWVRDELFYVSTQRGSMFVSGGADPRKFAETLLFYVLSTDSRRKFFEKIGKDLREKFFKLVNFELAPQEFQAELDEYKINPQLVNNFTEKLGGDIDALKQMFQGYIDLYVDAFSTISATILSGNDAKKECFFTIITRLDDYSRIEREELEEVLAFLPIEKYYKDASQAFKALEFSQIAQIRELECLFNQAPEEWPKARMRNLETFMRALKNYYAIRLAEDLSSNENPTSAERIKRISQLVKNLPIENQKELYKNVNYIILRFKNRFIKYIDQHKNYSATEKERKMEKIKFLDWIIKNISRIEAGAFDSYPNGPMGVAYNLLEKRSHDPVLIDKWLREVIFYNSPVYQAVGHGFGLFGAKVDKGGKGSKLAETMMLLPEASIEKILYGSKFSYKDLFEKAYPGRDIIESQIIRDREMEGDMREDVSSHQSNVSTPFRSPNATSRYGSPLQLTTPDRQSGLSDRQDDDDLVRTPEGWTVYPEERVDEETQAGTATPPLQLSMGQS